MGGAQDNGIEMCRRNPSRVQTVLNGKRRESAGVFGSLKSKKALLLYCDDDVSMV